MKNHTMQHQDETGDGATTNELGSFVNEQINTLRVVPAGIVLVPAGIVPVPIARIK
jgi:hypothetical protein